MSGVIVAKYRVLRANVLIAIERVDGVTILDGNSLGKFQSRTIMEKEDLVDNTSRCIDLVKFNLDRGCPAPLGKTGNQVKYWTMVLTAPHCCLRYLRLRLKVRS